MTSPFIRSSIRQYALLLPTILLLALFLTDRPGQAEAAKAPAPEAPSAAAPAAPTNPAPPAATATPAPASAPPAAAPATAPTSSPPLAPAAAPAEAPDKTPDTGAPPAGVPPSGTEEAVHGPGSPLPPGKGKGNKKYDTGEDPEYAKKCGWPVKLPPTLPGSILPQKRIVAYYGNPLSKKMGVLGEYPKDEMLRRLKVEVAKWEKADPTLPVQPALHLVTVVAQGEPGKAGKYRMVMPDKVVNEVYDWAKGINGIFFIDIQTGHENIRTLLPRFEWILKNPDVHLAMDPEFNMIKSGRKPGTKIGTYDAADVNYASGFLVELVKKYHLPPKVFIVHRFTRNMVTNARSIVVHPEVQIVMNMDGWGPPWLKRDSYRDYIIKEPVEYTGFKLFYHNDTKKGDPLMTPQDLLRFCPRPIYIQYQ